MISRLTSGSSYDAVFIDCRAGMAEIAAPVILGLGATVFLFGTSQQQTFHGYEALFASLRTLAMRDRASGSRAEWRLQLKAVYAKASLDEAIASQHRDALFELFAENLYDADDGSGSPDAISYDIDDFDAPHWPVVIPFNQGFLDFDPLKTPTQLTAPFYGQVFAAFLKAVDAIVSSGTNGTKKSP